MNYELKEENDAKLAQKEDNDKVLDLKEHMDKTFLKISTLKSSTHFIMQRPREEHDEVLNAAKDNGTAETIEELDKLSLTLENKFQLLQLLLLVILYLCHHMYQV